MASTGTPRKPRRLLRWAIALAIAAVLLAAYAVTLDRVATRIGLDAENTLQATPRDRDTHHRSD
ncbi:hypothetical protein LDO26_02745 [Luteimonas sp. BDR2-5]|uniref:hypothetical protein n=1 Tax=Proluteimonas luteida TaxID=2878685 RepID=UPI001E46A466|nr:hypothetical protein [Luteimonas sp. BDR2-5]MCD9027132.1 hypothetical protein [Luteimonas sp. BDR2-5]